MRKSTRSSKLKKKRISEDRISDLPESIIADILSLLSTKDAVATSLLSRSWRLRWTRVTSFDFDETDTDGYDYDPEIHFVDFVNMVLLNHRAEFMNKFCLKWMNYRERYVYLSIWANTAIARNVQVLDLALLYPPVITYIDIHLPSAVYTCRTLEVLKLQGPILVKVPHLVCLPKLVVLELNSVRYESEDSVSKLVSACPVLQSLKIQRDHYNAEMVVCTISSPVLKRLEIYFYCCGDCAEWDRDPVLKIETPALECLHLHDEVSVEISIQGQTLLNQAELCLDAYFLDDYYNMVVELVQALDRVTVLKLSKETFSTLSFATNQLSGNFERLTTLVIHLRYYACSFLMNLIDGCMKLEVLDITMEVPDHEDKTGNWRNPVRVPGCLLSTLREFSCKGFDGLGDEMALLKSILKHGSVMERVDLRCDHASFSSRILNKVSRLPRVSPTCKISYS